MDLPKPTLSLEHTLVPSDRDVHNPIVEITTQSLANKDSNLRDVNMEGRDTIVLYLRWVCHMCQRWRIVRIGNQGGWAVARTLQP